MLSLFCSWRKWIREVKWCFQGQRRAGSGILVGLLHFAPSGAEPFVQGHLALGC